MKRVMVAVLGLGALGCVVVTWRLVTVPVPVRGVVVYSGPPARRPPIPMAADPTCAGLHGDPVSDPVGEVGEDGRLPNAIVFISEGVDPVTEPPAEDAVIAAEGCLFKPRVLGMVRGQRLRFVNRDTTANHHFNVVTPRRRFSGVRRIRPDPPPVVETRYIKCDVHPWMQAVAAIIDHPHFATTDAAGRFRLPQRLSPGDYEITAWHPHYGSTSAKITLRWFENPEVRLEVR